MKTITKFFLGLLLVLSIVPVYGQNLVPNPDFETHTACTGAITDLSVWNNPTGATPDYYNTCITAPFGLPSFGVPANILGNQTAHSGDGYAGIITYEDAGLFGPCPSGLFSTGWREYLQIQLISPLVSGNTYCVSFYVSLADKVKYATEDMGMYFSNTPVAWPDSVNLPYTPQVTNATGMLSDTLGWTQVTGSYLASGGEQYIVIGNFKNDAGTTKGCSNASAFNPYAYYYIDDVFVGPSGTCPTTACALAVDFTIDSKGCGASTGDITAVVSGSSLSYSWSTGANTASIIGVPEGTYYVTVTDGGGCVGTDSVVLDLPASPVANAGIDDTICRGSSIVLNASGGGSYLWNTGDTTASILVSPFGSTSYSVEVTNADSCTDIDAVNIYVIQPLSMDIDGPPGPFCNSDAPIMLSGTPSGGSFSGTGMSGSSFDPTAAGPGIFDIVYTVVGPTGCSSSDTISYEVVICTGITGQEGDWNIKVFYNGEDQNIYVQLETTKNENLSFNLYDLTGRLVANESQMGIKGKKSITLNAGKNLSSGVYLLEVTNSDVSFRYRIYLK